jgi:hypothetical protein
MKILVFLLLFTSCSSLKRQRIISSAVGTIIGGVVGAHLGKALSPNGASETHNAALGGSIGVLVGGASGYGLGTLFWRDNPENMELKQMILEDKKEISEVKIDSLTGAKKLNESQISPNLPKDLVGRIKNPIVIEYEVPPSKEREGNRVIYKNGHKAYEVITE